MRQPTRVGRVSTEHPPEPNRRRFPPRDGAEIDIGRSPYLVISILTGGGLTATEVCDLYRGFGPKVFWNPVRLCVAKTESGARRSVA